MAPPPLIPLRHFFDNPTRAGARVSPDGSRIAYLADVDGRLNVFVKTRGRDDDRPVTNDRARNVVSYMWSRDGRRIAYMQDEGGNENFHVFVVELDDPAAKAVDRTPFEGVTARPMARPVDRPDEFIVGLNRRDRRVFDVFRLSIADGSLAEVHQNPGSVTQWVTDFDGEVRAAVRTERDGSHTLVVDGRDVTNYGPDDRFGAITFAEGGILASSAKYSDRVALVRIDPSTGSETVLAAEEDADFSGLRRSSWDDRPLAVAFRRDKLSWRPLDDEFGADLERASTIHPGTPLFGSSDRSERWWTLGFEDDRDADATYLWDRRTGEAELLFRARPWLDPRDLAPMEPVSFNAADGLTIHGYLTLPVGVQARGLPTVLYVHGGPWARDVWGFNGMVQFLANRGYAVLQVNYRGSTGYGRRFVEAAVGEWAGRMHSDLIDGVRWIIDRGIADPKRVAIYGGSYGGYATLVGMTFTPEWFACGASICGPSSLVTLIESFPPYWAPDTTKRFIRHCGGDPSEPVGRKELLARSPMERIDQIRAPLLIAQGANDVRVTRKESDQIAAAARAKGLDVEYIVKDDEGHGFQNPENRLDVYGALERFLAKHLGGRSES